MRTHRTRDKLEVCVGQTVTKTRSQGKECAHVKEVKGKVQGRCCHVRIDWLNKRPRDLELHRQVFACMPIVLVCGFIIRRCANKIIDLKSNPNRIHLQNIEGQMID